MDNNRYIAKVLNVNGISFAHNEIISIDFDKKRAINTITQALRTYLIFHPEVKSWYMSETKNTDVLDGEIELDY